MSNVRPMRSGPTAPKRVFTPVPWGTEANPNNVPMPRGVEEWERAARPAHASDIARINRAVERYGRERVADMLGSGFGSVEALSDYSAWMSVGIIEFADKLYDAREHAEKRDVVAVAGAHYKARPVQPCGECRQDTPHSAVNETTRMCLVCGERSYL